MMLHLRLSTALLMLLLVLSGFAYSAYDRYQTKLQLLRAERIADGLILARDLADYRMKNPLRKGGSP